MSEICRYGSNFRKKKHGWVKQESHFRSTHPRHFLDKVPPSHTPMRQETEIQIDSDEISYSQQKRYLPILIMKDKKNSNTCSDRVLKKKN